MTIEPKNLLLDETAGASPEVHLEMRNRSDGWISVSDRLPEIDLNAPEYARYVRVLVATKLGQVMEMTYTSNGYAKTEKGRAPRFEWRGSPSRSSSVSYWRPLPAPPRTKP